MRETKYTREIDGEYFTTHSRFFDAYELGTLSKFITTIGEFPSDANVDIGAEEVYDSYEAYLRVYWNQPATQEEIDAQQASKRASEEDDVRVIKNLAATLTDEQRTALMRDLGRE